MRNCKTDFALDRLNAAKGLTSSDIGYSYFADIGGWGGRNRRSVYTIINADGGVTYSSLNGSPRERLARIEAAHKAVEAAREA